MSDDHDARTIHCGNLNADKITEELLYELFLQAGPIERVSIPKDNGKNRQYGFITYRHQVSVPYAMSVFAGTRLFNRDLRLNNRCVNRNNDDDNQSRGQAGSDLANIPQPILPNIPQTHQFQMQKPVQNPFKNTALRGNGINAMGMNNGMASNNSNSMFNMMPSTSSSPMQFPPNSQLDFQALLAYSAQLLTSSNGLGAQNMGADNNETHKHQSKMMHRHENRSHNQNSNYSRDRRNEKKRSRSRSRDQTDWVRNYGRDNKSDRRDRGPQNDRRGNDGSRRRNDKRI